MSTYLERYHNGEREAVWAELITLGSSIYDSPVYADAHAVARAIMQRARSNISVLVERLPQINYQFAFPEQVWCAASVEVVQSLQQAEHRYGRLPLALRTWFEVVGEVNFMGSHPHLSCYEGMVPTSQQGPSSDPLMVVFGEVSDDDEEAWAADEIPDFIGPAIDFALDAAYKANQSGGGPRRAVLIANFDSCVCLDTRWTGLYFVSYLRECFRWGGFPGLSDQPHAVEQAREERRFLTKDLLPI